MTWQYGYDAMGRPTTVVDPNGLRTHTYYDPLGRPIQIQQPAHADSATPTITSLDYDMGDNLRAVTDPRNLRTTYAPNGLGQVTAQSSPDAGATTFTYDAVGNLTSSTDARGQVTTRTYDVLDRLSSVAYSSGVGVTLTYGSTPGTGALGELTSITDESGSIAYTYDGASRVTSTTQITNGRSFVTRTDWGDSGSALDKPNAITYPSGNQVNYRYDPYGQVLEVSITTNANANANANANGSGAGASGRVLPLLSGITRNASNQPTGWTWASGNVQSMVYDGHGQLVGYNLGKADGVGRAAGAQRTVVYDAGGRITGFTHTNHGVSVPALDQSFAYDNLNRLVRTSQASSTLQYQYDANGNRTAKVVNGSSYANTIASNSNQLDSARDVLDNYRFSYDAAGNVTGDGVNTFSYSPRGRMASATTPGGTVRYLYNAFEQRVYKAGPASMVPTGAAYYVYDAAGRMLGKYDGLGNPVFETIYLGDVPVGVMKQGGSAATADTSDTAVSLYHVYADHLGAPRVITDTEDNIVWRWDTAEAFGATAVNQNPQGLGTFVFDQRLPGQVFDAETGLFDNWHRTYDARQGRYRQSDPIGLRGGINTYSYVEGNPLSMVDPTGEFGNFVVGAATGLITGYAIAKFSGDECYGLQDALIDAGAGAVGAGLVSKLNKLSRIAKLRSIANARGLENIGQKGYVETWRNATNNLEKLDIKLEAGKSAALQAGSKVPRFSYRVDAGKFWDPFTGQMGPKGALSHVPLEPFNPIVAAATGAVAGGAVEVATCGCGR